MRKFSVLIVFCALCLLLTACDPSSYRFDRDDLFNSVTGIELINYDNPSQKRFVSWVPNHYPQLRSFKLDNMTILETLDDGYFNGFLKQLSDIYFLDKYYAFDSPNGICIRLLYSNGDFEVISCNYKHNSFAGYVGKYNSKGKVIDFVGSFSSLSTFISLVNDFFETQISKD